MITVKELLETLRWQTKSKTLQTQMTVEDLLLVQLLEESSEIQKEICKAMRFGLDAVSGNDPRTVRERIMDEVQDFRATLRLLGDAKSLDDRYDEEKIQAKLHKIAEYADISCSKGRTLL